MYLFQFPKGSAMNPIKIQEFKQIKNDFQWHELLKLDKDQYLNFRVNTVYYYLFISNAPVV